MQKNIPDWFDRIVVDVDDNFTVRYIYVYVVTETADRREQHL